MRAIRFRQWIKNQNMFFYWGFNIKGVMFESPLAIVEDDERESQQFTGLKDKNGKEIYEGDIISNSSFNAKIIFVKGKFQMKIMHNNYICDITIYNKSCEVIGNLSENPELLKEKKE